MFEPRFPAALDSTIISTWKRCQYQAFLKHFCGMQIEDSWDLHVGKAFAHAMEVVRKDFYFNGCSEDVALLNGEDQLIADYGPDRPSEAKNLGRMLAAFRLYHRLWPLDRDNGLVPVKDGVECRFAIPILGVLHPDTGQPLMYAGRYDMKAEEKGGYDPFSDFSEEKGVWLVDEKTAKRPFGNWRADFDLSLQMVGYVKSVQILSPDDHIEGVRIRKLFVGNKELTSDNFHDVPVRFNQNQIDDVWESIRITAEEMVERYKQFLRGNITDLAAYQRAYGNACNEYNGCSYRPICQHHPLPEYQEIRWNPLDWDN